MKTIKYPPKETWDSLCKRPGLRKKSLEATVNRIIRKVKLNGDNALSKYSERFDGISIKSFKVTESEISKSAGKVSEELKSAIRIASENIQKFHSAQLISESVIDICQGVKCWRKNVAIEKVGLYIPGGSAPLFSTVLMLAIPANIAGCKEVIICTPPGTNGDIDPLILYVAGLAGIKDIYRVGGAQAIAAMAYGTESIPRVYKIFGPGNQYVSKAKEIVQRDGIPIDLPAGPSELLVIADTGARPDFIAADLLSQAEHGADSQVMLLSDSMELVRLVGLEIEEQIQKLPRIEIARKAIENSKSILLNSIEECMDFSNHYAPEHLIIATANSNDTALNVINAGSVFLGNMSCESAGDYATGTNHTLPTNGYARNYSGVSVESFLKRISFQEVTDSGIKILGPAIGQMAMAEHLDGHRNAVTLRLNNIK